MPKYTGMPKSFQEAEQAMANRKLTNIIDTDRCKIGRADDALILRRNADGSISIVHSGIVFCPFCTFYPDGRIKISTLGSNTSPAMARINAAIPSPYYVYKSGCHVVLSERHRRRKLATFLSSTTFTPEPPAPAKSPSTSTPGKEAA